MKVSTVIFDIGNVLVGYDWHAFVQRLFGDRPEIIPTLEDALFYHHVWDEIDRGVWSWEQIIDEFCKYAPELRNEIVTFYDHAGEALWQFDFTKELISSLKERGYQVLFLSNWSEHMKQQARQQLDFLPLMDGGVFSCDVKLIKPDPAIYQAIVSKYALDPKCCVFLDDHLNNVEAARACGLHAIHVKHPDHEAAHEELERLLKEEF